MALATKRPLGANGTNSDIQYPALPKRPRIDDATSPRDLENGGDRGDPAEESGSDQAENQAGNDAPSLGPAVPEDSRPRWQLSPGDIPPTAKKVYCVRRGQRPGFFFEWSGPNGGEEQVRGFQDNLYMSFPGKKGSIKPGNLEDVIATAIDFMNHGPDACNFNCRGKCGLGEPAQQQQRPKAPKANDPTLCRSCQQQPPRELQGDRWRICHSCWISGSIQSAIHRSSLKLQLCEEQTKILELIAQGCNVFFTGAAGTGKSRVLHAAVDLSKRIGLASRVVAPTGKYVLRSW